MDPSTMGNEAHHTTSCKNSRTKNE